MSERMDRILADKASNRERIAALPIEQKLTMMERLRDMSFSIQNPTVAVVSGEGVVLSALGVQIMGSRPPVGYQLPSQPHTPQNAVTLIAELRKQPERWLVEQLGESALEFAAPSQALLDFRPNQ